ncbi:MAG: retroviral-like aspartic protease family protein, partial [Pseudomonadota bacterium]|nr:retroviral-like aspartic protease family protein [Pseudomonadota bacterium]
MTDQAYIPPISLSTVADLYRRMTAPIRINGAGPFPFVVDTGANQSVLSEELSLQLSLPVGPFEPLNGVAGVENAATTNAALEIGGRTEKNVVFSLLPAKAIGGVGMLGLDRLEGQELTLDFQGRTLDIKPPGRLWRDPADIAVKAHRRDGQLTLVDADLAGIPLVAFLDSGAQNTIGNMALRSLALTRNPKSPWTDTPIVSATGQTIDAQIADLPQLRVGGMRLPNWPVAFADLHTFKMWDLTRKPAILLGVDVL